MLIEEGPMHGYGLRKRLGELLGDEPPESTVYDALRKLEKLGLVESYWAMSPAGTMRKYYRATLEARRVLDRALQELKSMLAFVTRSGQ